MKLFTTFGVHLLLSLFVYSTEGSNIEVSVITKDFSELADCVEKIVSEQFATRVDTVYLVSSDVNLLDVKDFTDELLSRTFVKPKVAIRQEIIPKSTISSTLEPKFSRRCTIFTIEGFKDFLKVFKVMSPELFQFNGFYLIVLVSGEISSIQAIFNIFWNIQIYNVIVLFNNNSNESVSIKTFLPFKSEKCYDTTPVEINEFQGGRFLSGTELLYPRKMKNLHNCPVRLSISNSSEPEVFVEKLDNGSYNLNGRDMKLIKTLSRILNFKIEISYIGSEGFIYENGTAEGPLKALLDGEADMSISDWIIKSNRLKFFDPTTSYTNLKIILVVPPGRKLTMLEKLIYPFSLIPWILILTCLIVGFLVIAIISFRSKATRNFVFGKNVQNPCTNMIAGFIGGSQRVLPQKNFARFLLMIFLMYSLIIRTIYQGSFYKLLQANTQKREVQSIDEMVAEGFKFYIFLGITDLFQETEAMRNK